MCYYYQMMNLSESENNLEKRQNEAIRELNADNGDRSAQKISLTKIYAHSISPNMA